MMRDRMWSDESEFDNWELEPSGNSCSDLSLSESSQHLDEFCPDYKNEEGLFCADLEDMERVSWVSEELEVTSDKVSDKVKGQNDTRLIPMSSISSMSSVERIKWLEENIQSEAEEIERLPSMGNFSENPSQMDHEKYVKKLLIQRHLILLLRAQKCQPARTRQESQEESQSTCPLALCRVAKNLMMKCEHGGNCTKSHCFSSHLVVSHWNACRNENCLICAPLRRQLTVDSSVALQQPKLPWSSSLGHTPPPSPTSPSKFPSSASNSLLDHSYATSSTWGHSRLRPYGQLTKVTKEWEASLSPNMATHLVHRIVNAICPELESPLTRSGTMDDLMVRELVAHAKEIETRIRSVATSRSDYYDLVSDRIYWIQTERLDVRRKIRWECEEREFLDFG